MREYPAKGIHTNTQNTASWKRRKRTRSRIIHESHSHSNIFIYIYFNIMYTMFLAFAISPQNVRRRWPPLLFRALNLHLLLLPLILNRVLSVSVLPPPLFSPCRVLPRAISDHLDQYFCLAPEWPRRVSSHPRHTHTNTSTQYTLTCALCFCCSNINFNMYIQTYIETKLHAKFLC